MLFSSPEKAAQSGEYAPDSAKAERSSIVNEPRKCEARIKGAKPECSEKKLISDHGLFTSYEGQ